VNTCGLLTQSEEVALYAKYLVSVLWKDKVAEEAFWSTVFLPL
jgi:hypothetical protein